MLRARGFNLANHSSFVWANADRITSGEAGSIPANLVPVVARLANAGRTTS